MWQALHEHSYLIDTGYYRPGHTACYLIESKGELALIDTGVGHSYPTIRQAIQSMGFDLEQLRYVLLTHIHLDHGGSAGILMQALPQLRLGVHHRGLAHLIDPSRLLAGARAVYGNDRFEQQFGPFLPVPEKRSFSLQDGDLIELGDVSIKFIDTPGHAYHHGVFLDPRDHYIYTGDAFGMSFAPLNQAGIWMIATTTPVAFDPDAWQQSLTKIADHQPQGLCLTHFGYLDYSPDLIHRLKDSIDEHIEIALQHQHDKNRVARIAETLSLRLLEQAPASVEPEKVIDYLNDAIELNSQGLDIWLQRRSK